MSSKFFHASVLSILFIFMTESHAVIELASKPKTLLESHELQNKWQMESVMFLTECDKFTEKIESSNWRPILGEVTGKLLDFRNKYINPSDIPQRIKNRISHTFYESGMYKEAQNWMFYLLFECGYESAENLYRKVQLSDQSPEIRVIDEFDGIDFKKHVELWKRIKSGVEEDSFYHQFIAAAENSENPRTVYNDFLKNKKVKIPEELLNKIRKETTRFSCSCIKDNSNDSPTFMQQARLEVEKELKKRAKKPFSIRFENPKQETGKIEKSNLNPFTSFIFAKEKFFELSLYIEIYDVLNVDQLSNALISKEQHITNLLARYIPKAEEELDVPLHIRNDDVTVTLAPALREILKKTHKPSPDDAKQVRRYLLEFAAKSIKEIYLQTQILGATEMTDVKTTSKVTTEFWEEFRETITKGALYFKLLIELHELGSGEGRNIRNALKEIREKHLTHFKFDLSRRITSLFKGSEQINDYPTLIKTTKAYLIDKLELYIEKPLPEPRSNKSVASSSGNNASKNLKADVDVNRFRYVTDSFKKSPSRTRMQVTGSSPLHSCIVSDTSDD